MVPHLQRVRPTAVAAWETTSETGRTLYRSSSAQASQLWAVASPTVQTYTDATKVSGDLWARPGLATSKQVLSISACEAMS